MPAVLIALSLFTAAATTMPLVPSLPKAVEEEGVSLVNIWNHALRNQKDESGSPLVRSEPGEKKEGCKVRKCWWERKWK